MSDIETALCKITGVSRRKKEGTQSYLKRLMSAAEDLEDDEWEKLGETKGAQEWVNAAVEADKKDQEVPAISGSGDQEPDKPEAAASNGKGEKPPAKKAAPVSSKKAPEPKASTKPAAKASNKPAVPGKAGSVAAIINLLLKDAQMSVADLQAALEKKGYTPTLATVAMTRAHTRQCFRVLKDAGHLKQVKM